MKQLSQIIGTEKIIGGLSPADNCPQCCTTSDRLTNEKPLERKIEQAIKLLQSAAKAAQEKETIIELAYSGGKDSDVILELAKMAQINFRPIYKNTTIDEPGTIAHCKQNNIEIIQPKKNFFQIIEQKGLPNRFRRFCCSILKEYPVEKISILGIRAEESTKRKLRYKEPTNCRKYDKHKQTVEQFFPILSWTEDDELNFIQLRQIKLHPIYYDKNGNINLKKRVGCLGCPLKAKRKIIEDYKTYPGLLRQTIKSAQKFLDTHRHTVTGKQYETAAEWVTRNLFYEKTTDWQQHKTSIFNENLDYNKLLQDYFNFEIRKT